MRFKAITELNPGDIVAADVFDFGGHIVVAKGAELTEKRIWRLREQGFQGVYIDDELSKDINIPETISVPLRTEARECMENGDIDKALKYAIAIIDEVLNNKERRLDMTDLRCFDSYTYAHSVNVAVLSCVLGLALKLSIKDLEYLVMAALLHDIGKCRIPNEVLNKKDRLTPEEFQLIKKHPIFSYEILSERFDIPVQVKNAVLFHHENVDGTGYPKGIEGTDLSEITKIIHVVDVYDALISDRPYKKGYAPKEAVEYLMGGCGIMFDYKIVKTFVNTIPLYPIGTEVLLSNGERAIILENKGVNNLRPVVRTVKTFKTLDLYSPENANIVIYTGDEQRKQEIEKSEARRNDIIAKTASKSILVVDDMKANIAMLESLLSEKYEVDSVTSGAEAIAAIRGNLDKYDMVLMDIAMPKMSGTEAAQRINQITGKRIPILFVSTKCDAKTVLACKKLEAAGYVLRPYQPVYLLSEIDRVLYLESYDR